jgi:hypothetical protein
MRRWRNISRLKTRTTMVRRYFRGWGWGLRTHHMLGAGFLASALGIYPAAASMGLAPSLSSAFGWLRSNAPAIESEIESAAKDPKEFGKSLPSKIVSAVETLGAQAAAANGISFSPPASTPASATKPTIPTSSFVASTRQSSPGGGNPNAGYPAGSYPAATYPVANYPTSGYPPAGYPVPYQYNYPPGYGSPTYGAGDIACYFSPAGGCTEAIVNEIRQAQQQILVQAYSFTSAPIANALVEAHNRGVAVYVVLDKSQKSEQYSSADFVAHAGIATLIDSAHAIAHNKVILVDRQTIITGSFNFSASAEKSNAENLLIIRNRPDLYQAYENNYRHHYEHSQPYQGRGTSQPSNHSHMPASNHGPAAYQQAGNYQQPPGYQHAGNYQQPPSYPQSSGYQQPAGYQQPSSYQQSPDYQPPNQYNYGGSSYPQTASPYAPSGAYR